MTEIMLLVVIIAQVALVALMEVLNRRERKELVNRIIARTTEDVVNLELADKTKVEVKPKTAKKEDEVESSNMTDDEFFKTILDG